MNHLRPEEQAVVVVSAMGKTTNALEEVWRSSGLEQEGRWGDIMQAHAFASDPDRSLERP